MPAVKPINDPTQRGEGDASEWVNEPLKERAPTLLVHTERPYNAEPPNSALASLITPETFHYRRQHTPVPVLEAGDAYEILCGFKDDGEKFSEQGLEKWTGEKGSRLGPEMEGKNLKGFGISVGKIKKFEKSQLTVTLMCTGNRRSEMNTKEDGETMGLPWKNGSISTARWTGAKLTDILTAGGIPPYTTLRSLGYNFVTLWGVEDYHISVPLKKALDPEQDCLLAYEMNELKTLPRDHGFPIRILVPGFVGARSVKWLRQIVFCKQEVDGMHQTGIAYKQLGPNIKSLGATTKDYIKSMPPVDHSPITSAILVPEDGESVPGGKELMVKGYAYSGAGAAIVRVDVSGDGGKKWQQANITERGDATQGVRSGRAWAWVQWSASVAVPESGQATIVCKAIDDQYNQQPHEVAPIWNLRGILNNAWPRVKVNIGAPGSELHPGAFSGDGSIKNVGLKLDGKFQCLYCKQMFDDEKARALHTNFIHPDKSKM